MELQTMPLRFRVWDKKEKRFWPSDKVAIMNEERYFLESWVTTDTTSYIFSILDENRFIISQDTGLEDKNGKSIYTGDIIETGLEDEGFYHGVVCYPDDTGQVMVDYGKQSYIGRWVMLRVWLQNQKVIGNIWQNPELLEGKND